MVIAVNVFDDDRKWWFATGQTGNDPVGRLQNPETIRAKASQLSDEACSARRVYDSMLFGRDTERVQAKGLFVLRSEKEK